MTELSRFERVMNKVQMRMGRIKGKITTDMKGVKPFDMEKIPDREAFYYYENMTPEQKQMAQTHMPDAYAEYEKKMEVLRSKYNA